MLLQDGIRSIFTAALDATIAPGLLDDLATEREDEVARNGKFTKLDVGYIAAPPPPLFWEYRCSECRYWQTGACAIVQGRIDQVGYCVRPVDPTQRLRGAVHVGRPARHGAGHHAQGGQEPGKRSVQSAVGPLVRR